MKKFDVGTVVRTVAGTSRGKVLWADDNWWLVQLYDSTQPPIVIPQATPSWSLVTFEVGKKYRKKTPPGSPFKVIGFENNSAVVVTKNGANLSASLLPLTEYSNHTEVNDASW